MTLNLILFLEFDLQVHCVLMTYLKKFLNIYIYL